ncbi:MAG TPA: DUF2207 domain-containing protein [Vicinamibacterales bacterium]|nr:DUF2207 domain-containing protein [Vicinamibacterales bacterium]
MRIGLAALLWLLTVSPVLAKEYHASRFDSRIEVLAGGSLRVTETIVFVFTGGTFKQVFRVIPTRRTDGVEFVSASMDGRPLPQGEGEGGVRVRRRKGLRVEWNFAPVSSGTHTFELTYVSRGVVRQTADADLLEFRPLPSEHGYRIETSRVELVVPEAPVGEPRLDTRRVEGEAGIRVEDGVIAAQVSQIRRHGSFVVSVALPRTSVLDGPPVWQARQIAHRARMPIWLTAAAGLTLAGCVLLFGLRQNYEAPPREQAVRWASMLPPDSLPPAIGGTLAANGQPHLEQAMGALFSLAERGIVTIREEPRGTFGQRSFTLQKTGTAQPLAPHEEAAIEIIFTGTRDPGATIPLSEARSQFTRRWAPFKAAIMSELNDAHLLDHGRMASRRRYMKTGVILLGLAVLAVAPCLLLVEQNGGWPFLIPLALALVATTSFIVMWSQTPLSNEGVRRAGQWRAYQAHLARPQDAEVRWGAAGTAEARILPFAVALGLAAAWSKFMKKRNAQTPPWFHALSGPESGHAFAALIAAGGANAHGGGTPGIHGGGVAGGGSSGAH